MRFAHHGVELAFDDLGDTDAPAVLFLHGLGEARSTWRPFVAALLGSRRVLALDLRGHGESAHDPGTYTLEHYLADALALCDERAVTGAAVVGHSLGGVVAATMAQRRPELVAGVLLEDPPLYRGEESPAVAFFSLLRDFTAGLQARRAPVEEYEAVLAAAPSRSGRGTFAEVLGPERTRSLAEGLSRLDPDVFLPALDGSGLAGARPEIPLPCPALLLRADPALGATFGPADEQRFRATNPSAEVRTVDGASHLVHDDQPGRFSAELSGFLDRMGPSSSPC